MPVHFLMDEFANVSPPMILINCWQTMRSRNISVSIIWNIAQLKALFEKQWNPSWAIRTNFFIWAATKLERTS